MSNPLTILRASLSRHMVPLGLLASLYAGLMAMTWRRWADPLIDSGPDLYIPWRLSESAVLYRDIAHIFGPLSQYYHAALFRLFGVSYSVLLVSNAVWLGLLALLLYGLLSRGVSRYAGTVGVGLLLGVAGFGYYMDVGNYNFMSPYCHEMTHGLTLSVIMFALLGVRAPRWQSAVLLGAGGCLGLVLLTKPEVSLSAGIGLGVVLLGRCAAGIGRSARLNWLKESALVVAGAATVLLLASIGLHQRAPALPLYYAVVAPWLGVLDTTFATSTFYHTWAGMDAPWQNTLTMLRETLRLLLWVVGLLLLGRLLCVRADRRWVRLGAPVAVAALLLSIPLLDIYTIGRALPLLALAALFVLFPHYYRQRTQPELGVPRLALLGFAAFACALLLKMGFAARLHHYGVFLGMPALVVSGALLAGWLPAALPGRAREQLYRRVVMGLALALFVLPFVVTTHQQVARATTQLGEGADRLYAGVDEVSRSRAVALEQTRVWLATHLAPGAPLVVLPEGVILNYLTRHPNPTRFLNLIPPELDLAGEATVLAALQATAPEWVVIVKRDVAEFDLLPFGGSPQYGQLLHNHVTAAYLLVWQSRGDSPVEVRFPTCQVWQRRAATAPVSNRP